jgi:hypothetical protein
MREFIAGLGGVAVGWLVPDQIFSFSPVRV